MSIHYGELTPSIALLQRIQESYCSFYPPFYLSIHNILKNFQVVLFMPVFLYTINIFCNEFAHIVDKLHTCKKSNVHFSFWEQIIFSYWPHVWRSWLLVPLSSLLPSESECRLEPWSRLSSSDILQVLGGGGGGRKITIVVNLRH